MKQGFHYFNKRILSGANKENSEFPVAGARVYCAVTKQFSQGARAGERTAHYGAGRIHR